MAHAIHLSDEEMSTFAARGASVAHCPASNTRLKSGLCPLRRLLDHGIDTGLGTGQHRKENTSHGASFRPEGTISNMQIGLR